MCEPALILAKTCCSNESVRPVPDPLDDGIQRMIAMWAWNRARFLDQDGSSVRALEPAGVA